MLSYLLYALVLGAAVLAAMWSYRAFSTGDTSFSFAWLFPQRTERRLGVVETTSMDSRRKLVLIRRDDVEHLIMTGGPIDMVIETNIAAPHDDLAGMVEDRQEPDPPVFARKSRFGQAVNE
jgi:hypothetical protein